MNGIINIKIADRECRCFLNDENFSKCTVSSLWHKHNYAEIHVVSKGEMIFFIDKQTICAKDSCAVLVPGSTYHYVKTVSDSICHTAFQVELNTDSPSHRAFPNQITEGFFLELKGCLENGNCARISPYISLICTSLVGEMSEVITCNRDYAFIINEFFSENYNKDITVQDLAERLCLSVKQTQRLVTKHTGKTFGQNLLDQRMRVADYLVKNSDMTRSEIAEYVGYGSYSGFFKAKKKNLSEI